MPWSGQNLLQILEALNVPTAFLGVLLTMLLALTLAPFLGGLKVGPVEVPKLPPRGRQGLMVGSLIAWVVLLAPVVPTEEPVPPEPPCLLTAETLVADVGPQERTLDRFLRDFKRDVEFGHEIPVRIRYDESLEAVDLPQRRFTLHRTGDVFKDGCRLLTEIADGLNQAIPREDRIRIFASCEEVHVLPRDADPPPGDFLPCP